MHNLFSPTRKKLLYVCATVIASLSILTCWHPQVVVSASSALARVELPTFDDIRGLVNLPKGRNPAAFPKLVALDLDYSVWGLWVETMTVPPLKWNGRDINRIHDTQGKAMGFYDDVPNILHRVKAAGAHLSLVSRIRDADLARKALQELHLAPTVVPPSLHNFTDPKTLIPSIDLFDSIEIYPSDKSEHLKLLHNRTGIAFEDMILFDDEDRNREVGSLGVTFVKLPWPDGMNAERFDQGILRWTNQKAGIVMPEDEGGFGENEPTSYLYKRRLPEATARTASATTPEEG